MIGSATVARFAARGWGLYAVGLTAACGVLYLALRDLVLLVDAWAGDVMQQHSVYRTSWCCPGSCSTTTSTTSSSSATTASRGLHQRVATSCLFPCTLLVPQSLWSVETLSFHIW